MELFAEGVDVETPDTAPEPRAKRRQATDVTARRAEEKTLRSFFEQEPVARLGAQRVQHARREGHLALRSDFRQHLTDTWFYPARLMTTPASAPVAWPSSMAIWPLIRTQGIPTTGPSGFMMVALSSTRS